MPVFSLVLASSSASFRSLDLIPMSPWNWKFRLFIFGIVCKGCLDGGCEEKKHNARYSQQLQTGTGRRASFKTVPPSRDRLSLGGQSELMSWLFVSDHIHGTSSSTRMSRYSRLALAVTLHFGLLGHFSIYKTGSNICYSTYFLVVKFKLCERSFIF